MSQTGTPTEFLQLGITEPDDTLNVLVDLNGQWQKIDTGVKNVDTKANTNASGITALNTAVQDNTENITNILETNVNQQNSIDTLQSKVATLEEDDTSYGSRITAVEAGVQENSELINDLEVDLSGVKTSVGTVPEGSNLQGEVNGLDTRVTALENSGSVAAVEARVTTLETEVGTVPSGSTVQGQISGLDIDVTALQGQVNSGNIPFRFSVDGGGNYGYLKADDSFVPFSSGSGHWHEVDTTLYSAYDVNEAKRYSFILPFIGCTSSSSPNYGKIHDLIHDADYTLTSVGNSINFIGNIVMTDNVFYLLSNNNINTIDTVVCGIFDCNDRTTHYITKNGSNYRYNVVDVDGNNVGLYVDFTLRGNSTTAMYFNYNPLNNKYEFYYTYGGTVYCLSFDTTAGTSTETTKTSISCGRFENWKSTTSSNFVNTLYNINNNSIYQATSTDVLFTATIHGQFLNNVGSKYYYYI